MSSIMQPTIKAAEQEIQKYSEHFRPDHENAEQEYQGDHRDVRYPAHDAEAFVGFVFSGKVLHRSLHEPAASWSRGSPSFRSGPRGVFSAPGRTPTSARRYLSPDARAALKASMPPASVRTWRMPLRLRSKATFTAVASFGHAQYTTTLRSSGISVIGRPRSSRSTSSAPGITRGSSLRCVRERTSSTTGASPRAIISWSSATAIREVRNELRKRRRISHRYAT